MAAVAAAYSLCCRSLYACLKIRRVLALRIELMSEVRGESQRSVSRSQGVSTIKRRLTFVTRIPNPAAIF